MRVAVNLEQLLSPSPGGIGRYAARLVANLADLGVEVYPVVARHSAEEVKAAWEVFGLQSLPGPRVLALPRPFLYDAWHLLAWPPLVPGAGAGVDLVHAPSLAVPPKAGRPLVVSVHDAGPWLFPEAFGRRGRWFHKMGARAAVRRADRVITGTHAAADELAHYMGLPEDRIRVVAYGVGPPSPPSPPHVAGLLRRYGLSGAPYVLWVGSLEPRKGVGTLVAAMARLAGPTLAGPTLAGPTLAGPTRTAGLRAELVLAGYAGWQSSTIIAPGDRAVLGSTLHQLGRVGEAELQALYAGAGVFAFPSLHEGFGLPVLEAMAAGVPVVASDIPAIREVAGGAAVLVSPGDVNAWAEAIKGALGASARERATVVEAGYRRAAQFSWTRTAEATLAIYNELVG